MSWASKHIEKLLAGETVKFRPKGPSMAGLIESGQLVTVEPLSEANVIAPGHIVLCKVNGRQYLHLVKAVAANRFQIGNNKGHINGWCSRSSIYGRVSKVED